jgi:hypothetical protein
LNSRRGQPVWPHDKQGEWLRYRHLAVNDFHYGNRLMLGSDALRAARIQIYVEDVLWRHDASPLAEVESPLGNRKPAEAFFRFPRLPEYSVVVWQEGGVIQTLSSSCREHPDSARVDPSKDVYIQVNDILASHLDNSGAFDVWVRVVS